MVALGLEKLRLFLIRRRLFSLGRYQMFCALRHATMVRISSEHPKSTAAMSIFDMGGSSGNSAILRPRRVSRPSSSSAPRLYSCSNALMSVCGGGVSMKSK